MCDAYGWCNVISHFIVVMILSYASRILHHTKAQICNVVGGAHLNMCIGIWGHFEIFMHIFRGELFYLLIRILVFYSSFLSPNWYCHQSPKRGRLKVHLGPKFILVIFDDHNLGIWYFEESVCRIKMRNSRRRWKEGPQFQNEYGGFDRDLILIFGLNLSIGFTVLSRGTHSHEFLVVKMLHMRCNPWEKTPTKISHSTSSCTGSDDLALGRIIRPHSVWTFGVSPEDPALGRMIRTWWLVSI